MSVRNELRLGVLRAVNSDAIADAMDRGSNEISEIRLLLDKHVPEIASGVVEVRGIARRPGVRTIILMAGSDPSVDVVGAVVGERGVRVKKLVAELRNEMVDVVRWSDSLDQLIGNFIAPNRKLQIVYDEAARQAVITLSPDQRPDAAFAVSPNRLELVSELVGWALVVK